MTGSNLHVYFSFTFVLCTVAVPLVPLTFSTDETNEIKPVLLVVRLGNRDIRTGDCLPSEEVSGKGKVHGQRLVEVVLLRLMRPENKEVDVETEGFLKF